MEYFMPTRLHTGTGCFAAHAHELREFGTSCVIVTDESSAKLSGALDDVQAALAKNGIATLTWDGVTPNPPVLTCIEAGRQAAENGVQFVIGIGGGSSLDAAKAVAVFAANPTLDEDGFYAMKWSCDPLPIVLVGTTSGTGSEVTKVSVLTDAHARKHSIHDDRLYAAVSFGDSTHTHTCPPSVTLSCGVDVIAHAAESYFSRKADEISRAFAVRAIRLSIEPLTAAASGETLSDDLRRQMYEASILGGLAINTTGTCFPHNVGYYLTENYGVPHGFACAIFLPQMLEWVGTYDPAYAAAFYDEIGTSRGSLIGLISSCLPENNIKMTDEEIVSALPRWDGNGSVKNTRADVSVDDIHRMLSYMFC